MSYGWVTGHIAVTEDHMTLYLYDLPQETICIHRVWRRQTHQRVDSLDSSLGTQCLYWDCLQETGNVETSCITKKHICPHTLSMVATLKSFNPESLCTVCRHLHWRGSCLPEIPYCLYNLTEGPHESWKCNDAPKSSFFLQEVTFSYGGNSYTKVIFL